VNEATPTIYLIGGCNGAGKTTFAREFLTTELKCLRFLNPDEIARGLSPLDPSQGLFRAGRVLVDQIKHYVAARETFTIESTLSGPGYVNILRDALADGYEIELHYLVLPDVEIAIRRVQARVRMGGHNVPDEDVRRRFGRSRENLISSYLPLVNRWVIWDASAQPPMELARWANRDISFVRQLLL
jgi:predicted ABC-type ATPase